MRNIAILFLLVGLLAGCSGGSPERAPVPQASAVPTAATTPGAIDPRRKLVKNGALTLRVVALAEASEQIRGKAAELGGFISNSRFDVNSLQAESATIEAKVPSDHLDPFMRDLEGLGKVLSKSETAEDVTEQFVDMEARRSNLQREEERLLVILKSAGGLKDLLAVEQELARVRGELEQIQGKLKHLNYQADYSTVAVTLTTTGQGSTVAFWDLSGTVGNAWMLLKVSLRLILQAGIYFVFLLPLGLPAWWAHRRATRRRSGGHLFEEHLD